jgi:hypothetical protein
MIGKEIEKEERKREEFILMYLFRRGSGDPNPHTSRRSSSLSSFSSLSSLSSPSLLPSPSLLNSSPPSIASSGASNSEPADVGPLNKRVLVVDDNLMTQLVIKRMLVLYYFLLSLFISSFRHTFLSDIFHRSG